MFKAILKPRANGKPMLQMYREVEGEKYLINRLREKFHIGKENLFLIEKKVNSSVPTIRKFVLSVRNDGKGSNSGEHKLSQIDFDERELKLLRDCIDDILNYNNKL